MISVIRAVIAVQFNMNDITYDIAKASIATGLEPCVGLIAACLPMFPPFFKKIRRGKEKLDPRSHVSSTVARLRSQDSKKRAFRIIDDEYPLTDLEENRNQNDIASSNSNIDSLVGDQNANAKLEMYP